MKNSKTLRDIFSIIKMFIYRICSDIHFLEAIYDLLIKKNIKLHKINILLL